MEHLLQNRIEIEIVLDRDSLYSTVHYYSWTDE